MNKPRIDQLLRKSGLVKTRSEAHALIKSGRLKVDGKIITNVSYQTRPSTHIITVDDEPLNIIEDKLYFVLNKPKGVSCQQGEHPNVIDLIKLDNEKLKNSLFAVGRLDIDTTGLIIITNDGSIVHKIIDPKNKICKTYIAEVDKEISNEGMEKIRKGIHIMLDKKKYHCMPAEIKKLKDLTYKIKIKEGKKRQVRKMLEAVGVKTLKLKRVAIGNLLLSDEIKEGEYKKITKKDILNIFKNKL